jgi:hypothetical protein
MPAQVAAPAQAIEVTFVPAGTARKFPLTAANAG